MSLPAGASITSIGGRRCTAIPKVAAVVNASSNFSAAPTAAAAAAATSATSSAAGVAAVSSSTAQAVVESTSSNAGVATAAAPSSISQSSSATPVALPSSTQPTNSTPLSSTSTPDTTQAALPTPTSLTDLLAVAPQTLLDTSTFASSTTAISEHASSTPAAVMETDASLTQFPTSQSTYSNQAIATNQVMASNQAIVSTIGHPPPTQAGDGPAQSSAVAATSISSSSKINAGSITGGVVGGVALIGILFVLWWRYSKRRKSRDSLLAPLNGSFDRREEKYEIDGDSLGPTPLGEKLKAQVGGYFSRMRMDLADWVSAARAKFGRQSDCPSINMDRGNSQFLEPIQQHSRSNSALARGNDTPITTRDRLADWWQRLTADVSFNWRLRQKANDPIDHFTVTRGISDKESQANQVSPNFSQFLVGKDHELRQATERHRRSQSTTTLPQLESLGLEFSGMSDPFPNVEPTIPNISQPPDASTSNRVAGPAAKANGWDYVSSVRRSRGLSQPIAKNSGPATRLPNNAVKATTAQRQPSIAAPSSRYPSTINTSHDTYRDTVLSTLSISGRNFKGRSDPFDLDRPDILQRPPPIPSQSQAESALRSKAAPTQPRIESVHVAKPRIVSNADTCSSSKYSSGVSAMCSEWGDPGPDLGSVAWRRPGADEESIGSNEATRGSAISGEGSQIITVGRAL